MEFFKFIKNFTSYEQRHQKVKILTVGKPIVFNDEKFRDDSTQESEEPKTVKIKVQKSQLMEFRVEDFKKNFTDKEWKIISNNMKRREILSNDPV